MTVFERLHTLREPASFRAWSIQIAVMRVRQVLRRRRLRAALGLRDVDPSDTSLESLASEDLSPERRAQLAEIDRILSELPADERIVWMLRHVEGHRVHDIASECRLSMTTVKRKLTSASRKIDRAVSSEGWRR